MVSYCMKINMYMYMYVYNYVLLCVVAWKEWQLPTPAGSSRASPMAPPTSLHPIAEEEETITFAGTPQNDRYCYTHVHVHVQCIYVQVCMNAHNCMCIFCGLVSKR